MTYYKLTDKDGCTQGPTQWGEGETHTAQGRGNMLCTGDVIHVYDSPLKAVLMNPIHGNFDLGTALLWKCRVRHVVANDGTKVGVKICTTLHTVPMPVLSTEQRIEVAIRVTMIIYHEPNWTAWAKAWLNGTNAPYAAHAAAYAAADATNAPYAAHAAAYAIAKAAILNRTLRQVCQRKE